MSFFVVCLICNACSWLAEDPGVDVNWQNIQIMNKSGEKSMHWNLCLKIQPF